MVESEIHTAVYPLMEHYYTIQGEGYNTGKACYFLRLGGCDVGCVWCDVKESWDVNAHPIVSVDEMLGFVKDSKAGRVVVTGGEPLMHDLTFLTAKFAEAGIETLLETSGAYLLTGKWNWICVSCRPRTAEGGIWRLRYHSNDVQYHLGQCVCACSSAPDKIYC